MNVFVDNVIGKNGANKGTDILSSGQQQNKIARVSNEKFR